MRKEPNGNGLDIPNINQDAKKLLDAIRDVGKSQAETVTPGWFTAIQLAKMEKCSPFKIRRRLRLAKNIKRRKFRIQGTKKVLPVWHYSV